MNRFLKFGLITVLVSSGTLGFSFGKASASERVHLSPFMVNVIEDGGKKTGQLPISVYLDLKDVESARYVCGIAPRIRAQITRNLVSDRYQLDRKGRLPLAKIRLKLWPIAYRVIKNVKLQNMLVAQGTGKVSSSEARMFTRRGCRRLSKGK